MRLGSETYHNTLELMWACFVVDERGTLETVLHWLWDDLVPHVFVEAGWAGPPPGLEELAASERAGVFSVRVAKEWFGGDRLHRDLFMSAAWFVKRCLNDDMLGMSSVSLWSAIRELEAEVDLEWPQVRLFERLLGPDGE